MQVYLLDRDAQPFFITFVLAYMVNSSINNQEPVKFPDLEPKGPPGSKVLEQERAKASFDVDALTKFMYGEQWLQSLERVLPVLETDPAFDKSKRYFQNRQERIHHAYDKDKRIIELAR